MLVFENDQGKLKIDREKSRKRQGIFKIKFCGNPEFSLILFFKILLDTLFVCFCN